MYKQETDDILCFIIDVSYLNLNFQFINLLKIEQIKLKSRKVQKLEQKFTKYYFKKNSFFKFDFKFFFND